MYPQCTIGLYRENVIAIESEARDPNGGLSQPAVMCVSFQRRRVRHNANYVPDGRACARKECNWHCDVRVTAENKHTLPTFGPLDSFWIMRSQRSRRRDKGIWPHL